LSNANSSYGLPSQIFARRVRETRKRRDWTQEELAARLTEIGRPTTQATIARIEAATSTRARNVTLDEAFAFAAALGVAPLYLFLPRERDERVAVTRNITVDAGRAQDWLVGTLRLRDSDDLGTFLSERNREALYALLAADAEPRLREARRAELENKRRRHIGIRRERLAKLSGPLSTEFEQFLKDEDEMDIEEWALLYYPDKEEDSA
jgi:transcriptional regulator with XRE-family HTH domain